jgi:uncharacterized membrane protein YkvA (DUF1232 family)
MEVREQTRRKRVWQHLAATLRVRTRQLLNEFRVILRALAHPGVPWLAKLVCGCAVLYVVSPIQLIPNFVPVLGQLDDVLVVGFAIRVLRRCAPPNALEECQAGHPEFVRLADFGEGATPMIAEAQRG